jgi:prepilin-type N-terminal cleavage/methylation domain-containing protein
MRRTTLRPGYTLLEVIIALGLSLILVAGIYSAVQMTYQQWEVGRQAADEAQVVRALFQRIRSDLQGTMTTWAPPQTPQQPSGAAATTGGATTSSSGSTGSSASGGSGTSGSAGGVSSSGSTSSTTSDPSTTSTAEQNPTLFAPGGVYGESDAISAVVRAAPSDVDFSPSLPLGTPMSVLRTVTYRVGVLQDSASIDDGVEGLIRDESPRLPDAMAPEGRSNDTVSDLLAPEVKRLRLSYYDGLFWSDTWDVTQTGPPVCVQVEVGLKVSTLKNVDADGLRWYQALIAFPAAASASEESASPTESTPASSSSSGSATSSGASGGGAAGGTGS